MIRLSRLALTLAAPLLMLAAPALAAQESPEKVLGEHLFPPELVMKHQQKIGLRPAQRTEITEAIGQATAKFVDLQWRMQEASQKLLELIQAAQVDEDAALAQIDRVLTIERDVKREQMSLLIRIKNVLTREQQAQLRALR
jgi:Spy/CpxP family protein refolding chaperone